MAKKNVIDSNASLFDIVSSLNSTAEIIDQSLYANIPDWISTGSYILNAGLSGSLFGGCPAGRVLTFAGNPGCLHKNETVDVYIFKGDASNKNNIHKINDLRKK